MKKSSSTRSVLPFQNFSLLIDSRDEIAFNVALKLYESLDTPISLGLWLRLKYGEFLGIAEAKIHPLQYEDSQAHKFELDYQAISFLRKYPNLPCQIDKEAVALKTFLDCEKQCEETNIRLSMLCEGRSDAPPHIRQVLWLAMGKISQILGEFDWEEFSRSTGWGPGATDVAKGAYTSGYNKFSGPLSVTDNCLPLALTCINTTAPWASYISGQQPDEFEVSRPVSVLASTLATTPGGKIIFVDKDATTKRTITVSVSLNSYCQKGFGRMLRARLKRAGVDLDHQDHNQRHALLGSRYNDRATLDAKSASDCVSTGLVRLLLPEQWFNGLNLAREQLGYLKSENRWIQFQKFSAMGNSYTFELESLIFYALQWASMKVVREASAQVNPWTGRVYPDVISTFGDDMIVPGDCVQLTEEVLSFCGFLLNKTKTHVEGPFRESCGKDYFAGILVRPIFLKERVHNAETIYKLANNIRRIAHRSGFNSSCDVRFMDCWKYTCSFLKSSEFLRVSEGYGDIGVITNLDEANPDLASRSRRRIGWEGWVMRSVHHFPVKESMWQYGAAMASILSTMPEAPLTGSRLHDAKPIKAIERLIASYEPREGRYDLRGRTKARVINSIVTSWYNLGPWL